MEEGKSAQTLAMGLVAGSVTGMFIGIIVGAVTDNIAFWVPIGLSIERNTAVPAPSPLSFPTN